MVTKMNAYKSDGLLIKLPNLLSCTKSKIFNQPKNRQDSSVSDDFWSKSIASMQTNFLKMFE